MDKQTTINVKPETVERLKKFKLTPSESYTNIIARLLEKHGGEEE